MNGCYPPQYIDILFDGRTNFQESKTTIAVSIFKTALSSQLLRNLITTDIRVWPYSLKIDYFVISAQEIQML